MEKPIQIKIEETKNKVINILNQECNDNGIDYYFLENILKDIYVEVQRLKENELKDLQEKYENSIKESD